jgi:hypothetical protein
MPTLSKHYATVTFPNGDTVEPISIDVTVDETWAPYVQASVILPINLITDDIDPRQDSRLKIRLQQDFGDLIYIYELTDAYGGDVSNITAAYTPVLNASITRDFAKPWNIFEPSRPISYITGIYGGDVSDITAAGLSTVWRMSKFLQDSGTFNPEPSTIFNADLGIRSINYNYISKEATIALASDEALAQDVHGYGDDVMVQYFSLRDLINEALSFIFAELEPGTADQSYPLGYNLEKYEVNVENTLWDFIETITTASGFKVYCDEMRRWYLVEDTATAGSLVLDDTDNITAFEKEFSRDTLWYNQAVIEYQDPSAGVSIFDSYYATGTGALRTLYQKKENMVFPGFGAAQAIVERSLTRGETYNVEAIANFDARPRQTLVVDITGEPVKTGVVQSITWALPSARMSVDIRNLEEV